MKYKKIMTLLLCVSIAMVSSRPLVHASELPTGNGSTAIIDQTVTASDDGNELTESEVVGTAQSQSPLNLLGTDINGVFADMQQSLLSPESSFTLSGAIGDNSGVSLSADSLFDLSDMSLIKGTILDMGTTNLKYNVLSTQMMDSFNSVDLTGGSSNCMDLFSRTYGNLAEQISLSEPTIPEGFSVKEMITSASNSIDSAYSSATGSGSFSAIKSSVSIGNIFSVANAGLSMPELSSMDTLNGMIEVQSANNLATISSSYSEMKGSISKEVNGLRENLMYDVNENFLSVVDMDNAIIDMDGSISEQNLAAKSKDVNEMFSATGHKSSIGRIGSVIMAPAKFGMDVLSSTVDAAKNILSLGVDALKGAKEN